MRTLLIGILCLSSFAMNAQILSANSVVGQFTLDKLEFSQQYDSNLVKLPPLRWSVYNQTGLNDCITIAQNLSFKRSLNYQNFYKSTLVGQFELSNNRLYIKNGFLYSMDNFTVESIDEQHLVLIEKFKMSQVRRTFRRN